MEAMNRRQFVKIGAVAGLSIFAFGALPGCGQEAVGTDAGQQGGKTMRTVTDMLGRDVEVCVPEEITAYGCNAWAEVPFMSMLGVTDALLAGYDLDITENMKILYPGCDHYTERPCSRCSTCTWNGCTSGDRSTPGSSHTTPRSSRSRESPTAKLPHPPNAGIGSSYSSLLARSFSWSSGRAARASSAPVSSITTASQGPRSAALRYT